MRLAARLVPIAALAGALCACSPSTLTPSDSQGAPGSGAGDAPGAAQTVDVVVQPGSASITSGDTLALTADVYGTSDLRVRWRIAEPDAGSIDGQGRYTAPHVAGTYHVVAASVADESITDTATITVNPAPSTTARPPSISAFSASPAVVAPGGDSTLSWTVTGATSITIDQGIGTVTGSSVVITPSETTSYTLTATNDAGSATASTTVTVTSGGSGGGGSSGGLAASPASFSVGVNGSQQLTVSGGTKPYRWKTNQCGGMWVVGNGSGAAPHTATFHAPSLPVTCTITVTDSSSTPKTATVTATVTGAASGTIRYVCHPDTCPNASDSNDGSFSSPWATLGHAAVSASPGMTIYIRGRAGANTEQDCSSNSGACWTETRSCSFGTCGTLSWEGSLPAGTSGNPISFRGYPGETVILQPSGSGILMPLATSQAHMSYLSFENLILDGRDMARNCVNAQGWDTGNPATDYSAYVTFTNVKARHCAHTSAFEIYGYHWTFTNVEAYENGSNTETRDSTSIWSGDHDHAYYILGTYNTIEYGRIHHNIQAVQTWNGDGPYDGHHVYRYVEIDNNGYNPFNGQTRSDGLGQLGLYNHTGSYNVIEYCNIHDNSVPSLNGDAPYAVSFYDFGSACANSSSATNNWIWNNARSNAIFDGCSGNTTSPNTYAAP
jgi:hypothetical protein